MAVVIVALLPKLLSQEDTWICQNGEWVEHGKPAGPKPTGPCEEGEKVIPQKEGEEVTMPNPAAKNCLDKGGKLVSLTETAGQLGICQFIDGSQCEEWQFYRDECRKGQYTKADTSHPYRGRITKVGSGYVFKDDSGVEYTLNLPTNATKDLQRRLATEAIGKEALTVVAAETPPLSKVLILKGFQEK